MGKKLNATPMLNGVYRILCVGTLSNNMTVVNSGTATGTKLNMSAYLSDSKSQYARITKLSDDTVKGLSYINLCFQCNGETVSSSTLYPSVSGQSATVGESIQLRTSDISSVGANKDRAAFYIEPDGLTWDYNGYAYQTYKLVSCATWNGANKKYVIDSSSSELKLAEESGNIYQRFIFIRDNYYNSSLLPTNFIVETEAGINLDSTSERGIIFDGGTEDNYQLRIRSRNLAHNTGIWGEWTDWYSPADLKEDEGFGNGSEPNSGRFDSVITCEAANRTKEIDSVQYELFARQISGTGPYKHGSDSRLVFSTKQNVTFELVSATMTNEGLKIVWTSNAYREIGQTRAVLENIYQNGNLLALGKDITFSSLQTGVFLIPTAELLFYPVEGSTINVHVKFASISDYVKGNKEESSDLTVSYDGGELHPIIHAERINKFDTYVTVTERDGKPFNKCTVAMTYEHNGNIQTHELDSYKDGFICYEPLNITYALTASIEDTTSWATWGSVTVECKGIHTAAIAINTANTEVIIEKFAVPFNEVVSENVGRNNESIELMGNQLPDKFRTTIQTNDFSANGLLYDNDYRVYIERAIVDGLCLFRDFKGKYIWACIGNSTITQFDMDWEQRSIEFSETYNKFDIATPVPA